jgi:hypothetical protein
MAVPIGLIVDDSCPLVHVFRSHWIDVHHEPPLTKDGRPLLETIPNAFLDRFCDVVEKHGICGKFSIVPAPGGQGDVVRGIAGHDQALTREWLETMKRRLGPLPASAQRITHNLAVNLAEGAAIRARTVVAGADRATLTPYLIRQLELLRDAGVDATGVTSPWVFGIKVEPEYVASIAAAQRAVYGRRFSWYFLHMLNEKPDSRPWIALETDEHTLVSIPSNVDDAWWQTIDSPRSDAAYERHRRSGPDTGWPPAVRVSAGRRRLAVLLTHWQCCSPTALKPGWRCWRKWAGEWAGH